MSDKPKDGATIRGYCDECKQETTWVYVTAKTAWGFAANYWRCLGCNSKREAS